MDLGIILLIVVFIAGLILWTARPRSRGSIISRIKKMSGYTSRKNASKKVNFSDVSDVLSYSVETGKNVSFNTERLLDTGIVAKEDIKVTKGSLGLNSDQVLEKYGSKDSKGKSIEDIINDNTDDKIE